MVELHLLTPRRVRWLGNRREIGCRHARRRLARFIRHHSSHFPVCALIQKIPSYRSFDFAPALVNNHAKLVVILYKRFMILMPYRNVSMWMKEYIDSNDMYEQERYHYSL